MNFLYIIFTLVLDVGPHNNPTGHPALPPSNPTQSPGQAPFDTFSIESFEKNNPNYRSRFMGIDDRYPVGIYDQNDFFHIAKLNDSFEKLLQLQKRGFIEDIKKDELINEILGPFGLGPNEIGQFQIKSGGLFDDWERNI